MCGELLPTMPEYDRFLKEFFRLFLLEFLQKRECPYLVRVGRQVEELRLAYQRSGTQGIGSRPVCLLPGVPGAGRGLDSATDAPAADACRE